MFAIILEPIINSPAACLLFIFSSFLIVQLLKSFHSYFLLRHIPGPFWAHFTGLWLSLQLWRGGDFAEICGKLTEKYGPVVRFGPKNVVVGDPSVIPIIYSTTHPWRKGVSYESALVVVNGKVIDSLVTTRNEERLTVIKRHISGAFSARAVSDYEHHVDDTLRSLIGWVGVSVPVVDLNRWFTLYAFKTICQIAFSDGEFSEEDLKETIAATVERFEHWQSWFVLTGWEKLLYKNPLWQQSVGPSLLSEKTVARVMQREAAGGPGKHDDLLDRYLEANRKAPGDIPTSTVVGLVMSTINAGAETVAATMVNAMQFLINCPSAYSCLLKELEDAKLESPPTFKSVNQLPYLEATLKETMRLNSVMLAPLEREVPAGGVELLGHHIPAGVSVGVSERAAAKSEVWGPEPLLFRPERWLEADDKARVKMERVFNGFGQGRRMCIGKHIAWMEMKKAIPDLLLNYKFESLDPPEPVEYHKAIIGMPQHLMVKVTARRHANEKPGTE